MKKNFYEIYCLTVGAVSVLLGTIFLAWTIYHSMVFLYPQLGVDKYRQRELISDDAFIAKERGDCQRWGQSADQDCISAAAKDVSIKRAKALQAEIQLARTEAGKNVLWGVIFLVILIPVFLYHLLEAKRAARREDT